jgi:tetratricopeptide (TPR) repeat protein
LKERQLQDIQSVDVLEGAQVKLRTRRTKIVATLGPATDSEQAIERLVLAGVDVVRVNFSHGDHDGHRRRVQRIRETAARYAARGVVLVDADQNLAENGVTGRRQFTEHVHMTFDGMARLAVLFARAMGPLLPDDSAARHEFTDADIPRLKQRIFFTPFDEIVLNTMARQVGDMEIFRNRATAEESRQLLAQEEAVLRSSFPFNADQLRREYTLSKALRPRDPRIDESFAENLLRLGEPAEASRAGQRAISRKPNFFPGLLMLANVAWKTGDLSPAEKFFRKALDLTPLLPQAWTGLGDIARQRKDKARAIEFYEKALRVDASMVRRGDLVGRDSHGKR